MGHKVITVQSGGGYGQGSVGTSAAQLTSTHKIARIGIRIKNIHASNDLYVGINSSVTTANGWKLAAGEETHLPFINADKIYVVGSAAATTYCWIAI